MSKITTCRSCAARIVFIKTRAGKSMPCDPAPVRYRLNPESSTKVVTMAGDVVSCEIVTDQGEADGTGYTPHWSTCNAPDKFRKKGGRNT